MNKGGLEIERKFLIHYPDMELLGRRAQASRIVQTYLTGGAKQGSERVRRRSDGAGICYTHTVKRHISAATRTEDEREISEEEYLSLLERADPERRPVEKTRYCLPYEGQLFEIDVYPFWSDRAVMEIELEDEKQAVRFPPELRLIRELTEDGRYTNSALAKSIPDEDID